MIRGQQVFGAGATLLLHGALLGVLIGGHKVGCLGAEARAEDSSKFQDARVIEAGLARKKVEAKSKQPQKQKKKTFKPTEGDKVTRDENAKPDPKAKDDVRVKPDEIDIASVLNKHRSQDDDLSSAGADVVPTEGSESGSEWGTLKQARGDPYVGELFGRISSVWKVPSLEGGTGIVEGCVKLDNDGKIVERDVRKKSKNANLNRSVYLALKDAPDMETAVPIHLQQLLTQQGICFPFKLEN